MLTRYQPETAGVSSAILAPVAVRVGDFVFTSTLYPLGPDGRLVSQDASALYTGESDATLQSQRIFDVLEQVLEAAGARLEGVLRCEVMLSSSSDFYDFNLVWSERFASSPPARLAVEVGDHHLVPGTLIGLQAVALASDSSLEREIIATSTALDTLAGEHAAQAVRAGNYVFTSSVPAISDYGGAILPVPDPLRSVPEAQTVAVMENLRAVLAAAGTSLEHVVKSQNLMVDLDDWKDINRVWGQYMAPLPPPRSSVSVQSLITPGARVIANFTALVPDDDDHKEDVRAGLRFHVGEHGYKFSPAVQTRDWLSLAGHLSTDYETFQVIGGNPGLPHLHSEIEIQADEIMQDRMEILRANGADVTDIFEAKVFLTHPRRDYRGFMRAWRRWFEDADHAPALHIIPAGVHYEGTIIEIELLAARSGAPSRSD